jgi:hypothetical protein
MSTRSPHNPWCKDRRKYQTNNKRKCNKRWAVAPQTSPEQLKR